MQFCGGYAGGGTNDGATDTRTGEGAPDAFKGGRTKKGEKYKAAPICGCCVEMHESYTLKPAYDPVFVQETVPQEIVDKLLANAKKPPGKGKKPPAKEPKP